MYLWTHSPEAIVIAAALNGVFTSGQFVWMAIYPPELFPTAVRATAVSLIFNSARFISFLGPLFAGMERKWGVDEAYNFLFIQRYVDLSRWLGDVIEARFWHDWFHDSVLGRGYGAATRWLSEGFDLPVIDGAANGLASLTRAAADRLRIVQTGYVRTYALSLLIGVVAVLGYLLLR